MTRTLIRWRVCIRKIKTKLAILIALLLLFAIGTGIYLHLDLYSIPDTRLALDGTYLEMSEDPFRKYINLQVDHNDPSKGQFRGFYLLSPHFYDSKNITFVLTDGQMELVTTRTNFGFFEELLGPGSYVLMGVRGHSPTYLPEVYKDGMVDIGAALNLYSSAQQIEDIEQVRLEMVRNGTLEPGRKINIFGASGAGVLAQQYVSKYGTNVERVLLESTGAPDLSRASGIKYSPDLKDFNPDAAALLEEILQTGSVDRSAIANILYQLGRTSMTPRESQISLLAEVKNGSWMLRYRFDPKYNVSVLNYLIKSPRMITARVRWFELVGQDLLEYDAEKGIDLLYEISREPLTDLVDFYRKNGQLSLGLSVKRDFPGEVLVLKGTEDVVFSDEISQKLQQAYPNARLLLFRDGHRMQNDKEKYRELRVSFFDKGFASERIAEADASLRSHVDK
jgi:pimeloyl-ACP methyl ester carboxylesterase